MAPTTASQCRSGAIPTPTWRRVKRLNPTTTETTFKKGGKVTSVNTAVVAADDKTMTITAKGTTAQGQPLLNVQLYEKK